MVKELIKNDVLVVTTGCNAISCAKHGLLRSETAFQLAGKGLQEICRAVGIPAALHVGSCGDNSRILKILTNVVAEGGLGEDISELPVAGAAQEWMSEKAVSIEAAHQMLQHIPCVPAMCGAVPQTAQGRNRARQGKNIARITLPVISCRVESCRGANLPIAKSLLRIPTSRGTTVGPQRRG